MALIFAPDLLDKPRSAVRQAPGSGAHALRRVEYDAVGVAEGMGVDAEGRD
jgi:hypothetical protein